MLGGLTLAGTKQELTLRGRTRLSLEDAYGWFWG